MLYIYAPSFFRLLLKKKPPLPTPTTKIMVAFVYFNSYREWCFLLFRMTFCRYVCMAECKGLVGCLFVHTYIIILCTYFYKHLREWDTKHEHRLRFGFVNVLYCSRFFFFVIFVDFSLLLLFWHFIFIVVVVDCVYFWRIRVKTQVFITSVFKGYHLK